MGTPLKIGDLVSNDCQKYLNLPKNITRAHYITIWLLYLPACLLKNNNFSSYSTLSLLPYAEHDAIILWNNNFPFLIPKTTIIFFFRGREIIQSLNLHIIAIETHSSLWYYTITLLLCMFADADDDGERGLRRKIRRGRNKWM